MADQPPTPDQTRPDRQTRPDQTSTQRWTAYVPLGLALTAVTAVWLAGAVWSFEEQAALARHRGFGLPELLPITFDGMFLAMASVAWAASLDARPAVLARLGTLAAMAGSAISNASWAWTRSGGDAQTITLAAAVPVIANLAFEVLLSEVRRQVLRRRGQPGPVAITYPRAIRMALAPVQTFRAWRRLVLAATDPAAAYPAEQTGPDRPALTAEQTRPPIAAPDQPALPARVHAAATAVRRPAITATIGPAVPDQTRPAAVRNAVALAGRYPDRMPGQKEVERDLGWGPERARAALAALAAARQTRPDQTGPDQ